VLNGKSAQESIAEHSPVTVPRSRFGDPHLMSDAALMDSIQNWPGTDNDPLLDGLVREFNLRAAPQDGWITLGQHRIVTDDFTARANGLEHTLESFDRIGVELVRDLTTEGFDAGIARDIAANLRAQFDGDEIALQQGLDAAIADLKDRSGFGRPNPSFDEFQGVLDTAGEPAVLAHNRDFYAVSRMAIETAATQGGHQVTDEGFAQIMAYAIRNGVTVASAAREFFGIDARRPPADVSANEILAPENMELDVRIGQVEATTEALVKLKEFDFDDAVPGALGTSMMNDFDGDGHPDYTFYPDGSVGVSGYGVDPDSDVEQIFALVDTIAQFSPTDEQIASQVAFGEHLKNAQLAVSINANGDPLDVLSDNQRGLLERIDGFGSQIHGLQLLPQWDSNGHRYPNDVAALEGLLDEFDAGAEHGYSHDFLAAMRELLADEELLDLLAFTGSNDLHQDSALPGSLDLTRIGTLDERVTLAQILAPYTSQIDTNGDGTTLPQDLAAFIAVAKQDPSLAIPRRVIEAAEAALAAGYTDRNMMSDLHLMLDIVGATEIPVVSQLADLTNAGLYVVVDQDLVNAGISVVGVVATGTIALRAGSKSVREFRAGAEVIAALGSEADALVDIGAVVARSDSLLDGIGTVYVNGDVADGTLIPIIRGTRNGETVVIVDLPTGREVLTRGSGALTLPSGETIRVSTNGNVVHFASGRAVPSGNAADNAFARVLGPYADEGLQRPHIRQATFDDIIAKTPIDANGNVLESFAPGAPILRDLDGAPVNIHVRDSFHIGHVRGREHRRLVAAADELGLTQAQLNDFVNAHPGQLRVEGPLRNQSHIDEMPGVDRLRPIQDDMVEFFTLPIES
jgi:filamentous hemagglutinin